MDILKILTENTKDLYPEDLDFLETELATGEGYGDAYIEHCRQKIAEIRLSMSGESEEEKSNSKKQKTPRGLIIGLSDVAPTEANPAFESMTFEQIVFAEISRFRDTDSYKSSFKDYIKGKPDIDEAFIENHYSSFTEWEINAVVSVKPLSEQFLEKYFGALDHEKIARYQKFSENFFMKHFSQMNAETVLIHGKNDWRKKENRSKQLDVFLRLKGIKY